MTVVDHDFGPAVESLVAVMNGDEGRPRLHWPAPIPPAAHSFRYVSTAPSAPRPIPPIRPVAPPPRVQRRRARLDFVRVARRARALAALARIHCCGGCS